MCSMLPLDQIGGLAVTTLVNLSHSHEIICCRGRISETFFGLIPPYGQVRVVETWRLNDVGDALRGTRGFIFFAYVSHEDR